MTAQVELEGTLLGEHMRLAAALEQLRADMEEALGPIFGGVGSRSQTLFELLQRIQLATTICRWRIPISIAYWLAHHWPRRWLSKLRPELWYEGEAMTEEQFRTMWLTNSGMTPWEARHYGRMVVPCDCGDDGCQGWGMAHVHTLDEEELGALSEPYQSRARELLRIRAWDRIGMKGRP